MKEMAIIVVKNNTIEFQIEKKLEAHFKVSPRLVLLRGTSYWYLLYSRRKKKKRVISYYKAMFITIE